MMTSRERTDLAAIVRRRAGVAKTGAVQRSAELRADFEQQLATEYKAQDEAWGDLTAAAKQAVAQADAALAQRCRDLHIPEEFRPQLSLSWYSRGENASKARRACGKPGAVRWAGSISPRRILLTKAMQRSLVSDERSRAANGGEVMIAADERRASDDDHFYATGEVRGRFMILYTGGEFTWHKMLSARQLSQEGRVVA